MAIVIVTDANVLINLTHIEQLPLLAKLDSYEFRVPREVLAEIEHSEQRVAVTAALQSGYLQEIVIDKIGALELFGSLRDIMGQGEASCLALAATEGFHIASDEKKRFRRRAVELIGEERIHRTESLLLDAIRCNQISVDQADRCKLILDSKRYVMGFTSFGDIL